MGRVDVGCDVIGDLHGQAAELDALFQKLGYEKTSSGYRCPGRQAVFVGDLIDRGPQIREVVKTVRTMVDSGDALLVMGNHEFNAVCYHTTHPETGQYLRPHDQKNEKQHLQTLEQYASRPEELAETIAWFRGLPLWLDLGGLRVIHACWHPEKLKILGGNSGSSSPMANDEILLSAVKRDSEVYQSVEVLLKGLEVDLPEGISFRDKENHERKEVRTRWWDRKGETFRDMALAPEKTVAQIPKTPFPQEHYLGYSANDVPVFFGHYWLTGEPVLPAENICCLDYSVANPGGSLCCYRWDGESVLSPDNFVTLDRF